jgi:hypothetical protein
MRMSFACCEVGFVGRGVEKKDVESRESWPSESCDLIADRMGLTQSFRTEMNCVA